MNKSDLKQYRAIVLEINQLREERKALLDGNLSASINTGMPRGGKTTDTTAQTACKVADMTAVITNLLQKLEGKRCEIEVAVDSLPSRERRMIRSYYVYGKTLRQVAKTEGYSYSRVSHIIASAVKTIEKNG